LINDFDITGLLILFVIIFIVYEIIMRLLKRIANRRQIEFDSLSGIIFLLRFLCVFIMAFGFFDFMGVSAENLITVSSLSGMIIGFATSEVMSQIVAGFYIILTKPFGVRELVNIDGAEGIVIEIGVTYTIIQQFNGNLIKIPNKKILDSKIKNYTLKMSDELEKRQSKLSEDEKIDMENLLIKEAETRGVNLEKVQNVMENLSEFVFEDEVTRYTFDIEVDLGIDPFEAIDRLEEICDDYIPIFGFTPVCFIVNLSYRVKFRIRIYCTNPRIIANQYYNLLEDITGILYGERNKEVEA